jgi:hypothetical protein
MGKLVAVGLIALTIFYPRAAAQWIVTLIVAWIAAYLTVAEYNWYAPMGPFLLWFVADYILIQLLFGLLNRRHRHE